MLGYSPMSVASVFASEMLIMAGRPDEARVTLDSFLTSPRVQADGEWLSWAAGSYVRLAKTDAELAAGLERAREAARIVEAAGSLGMGHLARAAVGEALIGLRQWADAVALFESALDELRRLRTLLCEEGRLLAQLARLGLGDTAGAADAAGAAVDTAELQGALVFECLARRTRARVSRATGTDPGQVDADLGAALVLARRIGATAYEAEIEAERAAGSSPRPA